MAALYARGFANHDRPFRYASDQNHPACREGIDSDILLYGILAEEKNTAASLLNDSGLTREQLMKVLTKSLGLRRSGLDVDALRRYIDDAAIKKTPLMTKAIRESWQSSEAPE